jgi:hypothetical protein
MPISPSAYHEGPLECLIVCWDNTYLELCGVGVLWKRVVGAVEKEDGFPEYFTMVRARAPWLAESSLKVRAPHFRLEKYCRSRPLLPFHIKLTAFFRGSHDITKIKMVCLLLIRLLIIKLFCRLERINLRLKL